jgi:hypothetical protein
LDHTMKRKYSNPRRGAVAVGLENAAEAAEATDLLWFWEEHQVLICLPCGTAVRPLQDGVERHYRNIHKLKGPALQRVIAYEKEIPSIPLDPHVVELPANGSTAIEQLPQLGGYRCRYSTCRFLTIHPNRLTAHYAESDHAAAVEDAGSGGSHPRRGTDVTLQSFSRGRFARYWIVSDPAADSDDGEDNARRRGSESGDDSGYGSGWDEMLSNYSRKLAVDEDKRRRTGEAPGGADVDDPWVTWTGWAEHFRERDLAQISRLSKGPLPESALKRVWNSVEKQRQRRLRRIAESFERVMARCTRRLTLVPDETRRWLNSIDPKSPVGQPFKLKDHESSMEKYKRYGARYICYCFGAWEMGRETAKAELGVRFTDRQWDQLGAVVASLKAAEPDENGRGGWVASTPATLGSTSRNGRPRSEEDNGDDDLAFMEGEILVEFGRCDQSQCGDEGGFK